MADVLCSSLSCPDRSLRRTGKALGRASNVARRPIEDGEISDEVQIDNRTLHANSRAIFVHH